MNGGIVGLHHAAVNVRDWDTAIAFYRDVLGCEFLNEGEAAGSEMDQATALPGVRLRFAMFKVGGQHFELIQYLTPQPRETSGARWDSGLTHIAFKVADVEAAYHDLRARGVDFVAAPVHFKEYMPVGGAFAYAIDPNGVMLEFIEDVAGKDA